MPVFTVAVQNAVSVRAMGAATALTQFARQIGSTLGVAIVGVILNQSLPHAVTEGRITHPSQALQHDLSAALHPAFFVQVCFCLVVLVLVIFWFTEVPLRKGFDEPNQIGELPQLNQLEAASGMAVPPEVGGALEQNA
jgi:hypothetical protein